jgi:hypothetical protein
LEPLGKAVGKWAGRAAARFHVVRKRQLLNVYGLLERRRDDLVDEDALEGKTIEPVERQPTKAHILQRIA